MSLARPKWGQASNQDQLLSKTLKSSFPPALFSPLSITFSSHFLVRFSFLSPLPFCPIDSDASMRSFTKGTIFLRWLRKQRQRRVLWKTWALFCFCYFITLRCFRSEKQLVFWQNESIKNRYQHFQMASNETNSMFMFHLIWMLVQTVARPLQNFIFVFFRGCLALMLWIIILLLNHSASGVKVQYCKQSRPKPLYCHCHVLGEMQHH